MTSTHVRHEDAGSSGLPGGRAAPVNGAAAIDHPRDGDREATEHHAGDTSRREVTKHHVTRAAAEFIIENLRPRDREEIFALRWDNDERAFVEDILRCAGAMTWAWWRDGVPVSLQGAWPMRPGVWSCWAFGTEQWPRVVLSMTKHSRRFIIPALLRARFHRAEAVALATHTDSRRWIEALGAREEGIRRALGRNGEDFVCYVWTPQDVTRWWKG